MQDFIEYRYWPLLLKASWQAAVIILLVLAAQRTLGRRLTPRWRCGLWLLVALRLALPWTLPSAVSLFNILNFSKASEAVVSRHSNPDELGAPMLEPTAASQPAAPPTAAAPRFSMSLSWLPLLWAAGASALAFYLAISHWRLARRVTLCRPLIDAPVMNLLENCKQRMGVRVPVTLVETAAVDGPCLFGVVRPRLLLPSGFTRRFTPDELRYVFLHELGHVKRHDIPLGWLMAALQILHWFNPLVWLAFSRMRMDRELACDALALSHADERDNKPYGLTIVKLLESFGKSVRAPGLAGIVEDKQQMKERIRMIAQFPKSKGGFVLAATVLAGLAVLTLTDCTTGSKTAKAPATQSPASTNPWVEQQELALSKTGINWAAFNLWDAYYRGNHGVQRDPAQAGKYLRLLVHNLSVVRFEPVDDFTPPTSTVFLERLHHYADTGQTNSALGGWFRTKQQNGKLAGSFLSSLPDQLKANLAHVPGVKVTSVEPITPDQFIQYEQSSSDESSALWSKSGLDQLIQSAQAGNLLAAYDLWDAFHRGSHGVQPDPAQADEYLGKFVQNLWIIKLEPVGDFTPATPRELLDRVNQYPQPYRGTNTGVVSGFFRTKGQGGKLLGSFLTHIPDQLMASLDKVQGVKVVAVEPITRDQFVQYEQSRQESLVSESGKGNYEEQQLEMAQAGNKWGAYHLWDGYYRGNNGIKPDPAKADKWLREFARNVWVVRFEPVDDFKPSTPEGFLERVNQYAHSSSGQTDLGTGSFFRTTKQGGKLVGSFLCTYPDQLKAGLARVPGLRVTSVEKMTPEKFIPYEKSPQESLIDFNHLDASQGVWAVRFEPVGDFAPKTPAEFLARIPVYSGQHGEIGYFRTTKQGDKLVGSFLANDPDQLKAALDALPGIKVTSVEKLTQERLDAYEKSPQESLTSSKAEGPPPRITATSPAPRVVSFDPDNGAQNVNPAETELRVTFNVPMGGGCSWCTAGDDGQDFPEGRDRKQYYWTQDKKTCVLPVALKHGMTYRISLNAPEFKNFQSEAGVPLEPVGYTFKTNEKP